MSKFQTIVLFIFVLFIIAGAAAFALFKGKNTAAPLPAITVWGTIPATTFNQFVSHVNSSLPTAVSVTYIEVPSDSFNQNFVQAVARGQGPDAVIIPQEMLLANEPELLPIPYTLLPQRTFLDTYVQEADLYLRSDGAIALPFSIDPMVMYWNQDTFNASGVASAGTVNNPLTWSQLASYNGKVTQRDNNANIQKSLVALGEFANVDNAREILGSLFLQAGNPVTVTTENNAVFSALGNSSFQGLQSAVAAVTFYGRFSNPSDPYYAWNRSLPRSQTFFLAGNLATYFGFASELATLRNKNPNLNFDVAPMPQADKEKTPAVYARMYGISLVKSSANPTATYTVLQNFLTPAALATWTSMSNLPSVRRDVIAVGTTDPYLSLFNSAALISKGWLDPDPTGTATIFQNMIESISSSASTPVSAVSNANDQLNAVLKNI